MRRIPAIDITRGLIMIIMALDHVRDLMHVSSITQSPTDLATTTPLLFFTRWITHLCAPIFVFLAGTSVYLSLKKEKNLSQSRSFLLKRGLWLVMLEFTLVNFALFFDVRFSTLLFEVIAAIGFGFIVLSLLLKASSTVIGIIGLIIVAGHNLFPLIPFAQGSTIGAIITPMFSPSAFPVTPHTTFIMGYPPIPWLGIMLVGFASGKLFERPEEKRKGLFLKLGLGAVLVFVVLRFINIYGDAVPWSAQKNTLHTFLSFMNVSKYPPSLQFCLVTLGCMFLILAIAEGEKKGVGNMLAVYGKVPLFYFLLHFYLIHITLLLLLLLQGVQWSDMEFASGTFGRPKGIASGVSLSLIYLIWIGIVAILYKPCQWFGRYKREHKQWWLKYM